jgi:hypothetical protein
MGINFKIEMNPVIGAAIVLDLAFQTKLTHFVAHGVTIIGVGTLVLGTVVLVILTRRLTPTISKTSSAHRSMFWSFLLMFLMVLDHFWISAIIMLVCMIVLRSIRNRLISANLIKKVA